MSGSADDRGDFWDGLGPQSALGRVMYYVFGAFLIASFVGRDKAGWEEASGVLAMVWLVLGAVVLVRRWKSSSRRRRHSH